MSMNNSVIAGLILAVIMILYVTEAFSICVTSLLGWVLMLAFGIIKSAEAFAGFSSTATILVLAMSMVGSAFLRTGASERLGRQLFRLAGLKEGQFLALLCIICSLMGMFFNAMLTVSIFMPIIDALSQLSDGKITRRGTYLALAISSVFGGNLSCVGSSSMVTGSNLLAGSYFGRGLNFFEPALVSFPAMVVCALFYLTVGCGYQRKCFHFQENALCYESSLMGEERKWTKDEERKQLILAVTMLACAAAFISNRFNMAVVAMTGVLVLFVTGCAEPKTTFQDASWEAILAVVFTLGVAKGVEVSGCGAAIAGMILKIAGPLSASPYAMCIIFLVLGTVLSNVMSNNATVAILVPIALSTCQALGSSAPAFTLACVIGANLSVATPICTAAVTVTSCVGYRFKDYLKVGGVLNILAVIATSFAFKVVYF